ncbi:MAG: VWA domain-containing protein [Acidobacteria bacterium]|nr:VWA domain-containing protein [Acidobacteriota bacterium]MCB9397454.1 VWA domain-containing protein [Acidobacteriota bacterium]
MRAGFLFILSLPLWANGKMIVVQPPGGNLSDPQLQSAVLRIEVDSGFAQIEVVHNFFNPNSRIVEGEFLFPLMAGGVVEQIRMNVNGKETPAELLDAEKARAIYEEIVRRKRDPGLFEWAGTQLIKCRVFPIEARGTQKVVVRYRVALARLLNTWTCSQWLNPDAPTDIEVQLPEGLVNGTFSPTHELVFDQTGAKRTARLTAQKGSSLFELCVPSQQELVSYQLCHKRSSQGYFWLTIDPAKWLAQEHISPKSQAKDIAFVLDTSGSMAGAKMEQAQKALAFCLAQLKDQDRFTLIRFSTEASAFAESWRSVGPDSLKEAKTFVADLQAIGGTNFEDAFRLIQKLKKDESRAQMVLFITDGKPTVGTTEPNQLVHLAKNHDQFRTFTLGVGSDLNSILLDRLAQQGRGARAYVQENEDLELKLSDLFQKIQYPLISDLKWTCQGPVSEVVTPAQPDVFYGEVWSVCGTYAQAGTFKSELSGKYQGKTLNLIIELKLEDQAEGNAFLPKLWAQQRIGYLLEQIRLHGEDKELVDEVKRLAKQYGVVTPYTSFLILEDEAPDLARDRSRPEARAFESIVAPSGAASNQASEDVQAMRKSKNFYAKPDQKAPQALQNQWVAGKNFVQNGPYWQESEWGKQSKTNKIEFLSPAYFELVNQAPELGPVLAMGEQVRFVWNNEAYEIVPAKN